MFRRRLLILIPAFATAMVVGLLLGPARTRDVVAGRVSAASAGDTALRVAVVERGALGDRGIARPFSLHVVGEGSPRCSGESDALGLGECVLSEPLPAGSELELRSGETKLARGRTRELAAAEIAGDATLLGEASAEGLTLRAEVERGVVIPPFASTLRVVLGKKGGPGVAGELEYSVVNGEPAEGKLRSDAEGNARITLTPLAHPVIVNLKGQHEGASVSLEVNVEVEQSGIWAPVTKPGAPIELTSPAPREAAFVSLYGPGGRSAGGVVKLALDDRGFYRGTSEWVVPEDARGFVVSGDAGERGPSTVAWPVGERGAFRAPVLGVVLDGVPFALNQERKRARWVRLGAVGLLSLAAALELALLLWTKRRAHRDIGELGEELDGALREGDASRDEAGGREDAGPRAAEISLERSNPVGETILMVLVALGFAIVALLLLR